MLPRNYTHFVFLFVLIVLFGVLNVVPATAATQKLTKKSGKSSQITAKTTHAKPAKALASRHSRATYRLVKRGGRTIRLALAPRVIIPARPSIGKTIGLHAVDDPLDLRSSVAVVVDRARGEVVFEKNPDAVLPIASITKLMTAMVVLDRQLPMAEMIEVTEADLDTEKHSRSKLRPGTRLSRGEMMQLALMASENRAASALARNYPGAMPAFIAAMNQKAQALTMRSTTFSDPTGLSSNNVSSGQDLVKLVRAASDYPTIRQYSTASDLTVDTGLRVLSFRNTNRLLESSDWQILVSKTGYISEAGNCLVMNVKIEGRPMIFVLLDAEGRASRFGDAQRLRHWLESAAPIRVRNPAPRQPAPIQARAY